MFAVNDRDIKRLERELKAFAEKAVPFATRSTLNGAAFKAQQNARDVVKREMTLRNKFTQQSIQVDQTKTLNIRRQAAVVGSIADYMEDQEFGGIKTKTGKHGVHIPTSYAAGGAMGAQTRTRLPRKANRLENIVLSKRRRKPKNRKQANVFKVQDAVTSGRRLVYLDLGRRQGIFRVIGGAKKFKRGWPKGARLRMVHDLTRKSVVIPRQPWLAPAVKFAGAELPALYKEALTFQAKRRGLFRP